VVAGLSSVATRLFVEPLGYASSCVVAGQPLQGCGTALLDAGRSLQDREPLDYVSSCVVEGQPLQGGERKHSKTVEKGFCETRIERLMYSIECGLGCLPGATLMTSNCPPMLYVLILRMELISMTLSGPEG